VHEDDAIMVEVRMRQIKTCGLAKCVIKSLLLITWPSANQVAGLVLLSHSNLSNVPAFESRCCVNGSKRQLYIMLLLV